MEQMKNIRNHRPFMENTSTGVTVTLTPKKADRPPSPKKPTSTQGLAAKKLLFPEIYLRLECRLGPLSKVL